MKIKKTWFNCLLWIIFTAMTGVLLASGILTECRKLGSLNQYISIFAVCFFFILTAGIWAAGEKIIAYLTERFPQDEHFFNMAECFFVMCLISAAVLYRIYYVLNGLGGSPAETPYYEMAVVKASGTVPHILHGASYIYTVLLSAVFSFVGNKVMAGVILQFVIQIITLIISYFAIKMLAGRISAFAAAAILAFSPLVIKNMYSLTPEALYFLFYVAVLVFLNLYIKGFKRRENSGAAAVIAGLLLGICIGIMVYLDIIGLSLFFFLVREIRRIEKKDNYKKGILFLIVFAGSILASATAFFYDSYYSMQPFGDIVRGWFLQYGNNISVSYTYISPFFGADIQPRLVLLLSFAAALAVIGFWLGRAQSAETEISLLISMLVLKGSGMAQMNYDIYMTAVLGILAGIGLEAMKKQGACKEMTIIQLEPETVPAVQEWEEISKTAYIENPLPLPKKHVKKELDFAYEVPAERMEYDILVKDSDDFDRQKF